MQITVSVHESGAELGVHGCDESRNVKGAIQEFADFSVLNINADDAGGGLGMRLSFFFNHPYNSRAAGMRSVLDILNAGRDALIKRLAELEQASKGGEG